MRKIILQSILCLGMSTAVSQSNADHYHLLVGTYTGGAARGIYVYDFNLVTGNATFTDSVHTPDPSFLAVSADQKFVYAVNELGGAKGSGTVSSFSFDNKRGSLQKINTQSTAGDDPCYVDIDKTGNWLVTGNYSGGSFTILPIDKRTGNIGTASTTIAHKGKSIDTNRQKKPHVHCTVFSPDNKYLLIADLGTDHIVGYSFDERSGKTVQLKDRTQITLGAGPRHVVFSPNGKQVYLTEEMSGKIAIFDYERGRLTLKQSVNSLPENFSGKISSADIHLSDDGLFLYASNRGTANSISIFSTDTNGLLQFVDRQPALGLTPRNFSIDPSGNFLLVANQDSNEIIIFKRNRDTGKLTATDSRISVENPVCLKWIK